MFKLSIAARCEEILKHPGGNGGLAETPQRRGSDNPPPLAESGGITNKPAAPPFNPPQSPNPGGLANPATMQFPANPPNPPPAPSEKRGNVIDLRAYLLKLCQRLPMPPEHLLLHYFTADDLADIERGLYPDPDALGEFIKTDPRFPFGATQTPRIPESEA